MHVSKSEEVICIRRGFQRPWRCGKFKAANALARPWNEGCTRRPSPRAALWWTKREEARGINQWKFQHAAVGLIFHRGNDFQGWCSCVVQGSSRYKIDFSRRRNSTMLGTHKRSWTNIRANPVLGLNVAPPTLVVLHDAWKKDQKLQLLLFTLICSGSRGGENNCGDEVFAHARSLAQAHTRTAGGALLS